jgi:purine-binding chemotaxis protein CheW
MDMGMIETLEIDETSRGKEISEFLSFRLGNEDYAIDILTVREIRAFEKPTRIANTPAFICGVINLRGVIVPIVDMRIKFDLPNPEYDSLTAVIILNIANRLVGIVVDTVMDVLPLKASEICPAPEFNSRIQASFVRGLAPMKDRMLILMDIQALISSPDMALVAAAAEVNC